MKEKTQLNNQKVDVVKPEKTSLEEFSKDVFDMDFNFDDFNTNISESFEMLTEEVSSAIKAVEAFQKEEAPIEPEAPLETKEETSLLQRSSLNVAKKNSFADSCKSFFQKIGSKVARFLQALVENIQYAFGSLRFYGKIWSIGLVNFVKRNSEKAKQLQKSKKHYLEAKARSADAKKPREKTESFFPSKKQMKHRMR